MGNERKITNHLRGLLKRPPIIVDMLSKESKIEIISEIIHEHLKGKHKDRLSKELALLIIEELDEYDK